MSGGLRVALVHRGYPRDTGPTHGIERYTQMVGRGLADAGHGVTVLTGGRPGCRRDGRVTVHTIETTPPSVRGWWRLERALPANALWMSRAFARALDRLEPSQPDLVEFAEFLGEGCWYARRRRRAPVVVRVHHPRWRAAQFDAEPRTPRLWLLHQLEMAAIRAADAVTSPSQAFLSYARSLVDLRAKPAAVIPNPLDLDMFRPPPRPATADYFLFTGRLEHRKGADLLPAIVAELRRRGHPTEVRIVGGPGRVPEFAEAVLRELRAQPGVAILGSVPERDLVPLYQNALALLLPTRDESFGYSCLEAFACGTPAVTTRVGGLAEILSDGVEGVLAETGDVRYLAAGLCRLAEDRTLRDAMGERARRRAEQLVAPDRVFRQIAGFYGDVIAARGGRASLSSRKVSAR